MCGYSAGLYSELWEVKLVLKHNRYFVESSFPVSTCTCVIIVHKVFPLTLQDVMQALLKIPLYSKLGKSPLEHKF